MLRMASMNGATGLAQRSRSAHTCSWVTSPGSKKIGDRKNHGSRTADRIGATSRKYACSTATTSARPSVNAKSAMTSTGSNTSAGDTPRTASSKTVTMASTAAKVTSCTVTTAAGVISGGKPALRRSEPWSSSEEAAVSSDCEKNSQTTRPTIKNSG